MREKTTGVPLDAKRSTAATVMIACRAGVGLHVTTSKQRGRWNVAVVINGNADRRRIAGIILGIDAETLMQIDIGGVRIVTSRLVEEAFRFGVNVFGVGAVGCNRVNGL